MKLKRPSFRNEKDKKDKDAKTGPNTISSPKFNDSASKVDSLILANTIFIFSLYTVIS